MAINIQQSPWGALDTSLDSLFKFIENERRYSDNKARQKEADELNELNTWGGFMEGLSPEAQKIVASKMQKQFAGTKWEGAVNAKSEGLDIDIVDNELMASGYEYMESGNLSDARKSFLSVKDEAIRIKGLSALMNYKKSDRAFLKSHPELAKIKARQNRFDSILKFKLTGSQYMTDESKSSARNSALDELGGTDPYVEEESFWDKQFKVTPDTPETTDEEYPIYIQGEDNIALYNTIKDDILSGKASGLGIFDISEMTESIWNAIKNKNPDLSNGKPDTQKTPDINVNGEKLKERYPKGSSTTVRKQNVKSELEKAGLVGNAFTHKRSGRKFESLGVKSGFRDYIELKEVGGTKVIKINSDALKNYNYQIN